MGRFLGGAAGENLVAVHCVLIAQWFADQEVSLAYGLAFSLGMLVSTVSGFVVPDFVNTHGMGSGIMIGCFIMLLSTISSVCLVLLNRAAKSHDDELVEVEIRDSDQEEEEEQPSITNMMKLDTAFWLMNLDNMLTYAVL